ncbi:hypothetical protein F2P45_14820 [Massilia sp. CCM 8733]|uniref:Knr4/Smi1-like domain-containing protein n=1 Tax=Massilia mucilaginosa TaxID=2609282 RepID=A0ABX0NTM8_9BURK|nr:hypothetical protein [Massilia mucilaginosa]NHZ90279.1 hypothetical protein [Massilia mucilaginosa]
MDSIDLLKTRWEAQGIALLPGESALKVHMAFASAGATPAADVLALYRKLGGMDDMDNAFFRLWPLDEVIKQNVKRSAAGVQFSDYMISCWNFTVKAVDDTRSEVYIDYCDDAQEPLLVAGSLAEFFDICASAEASRVLNPDYVKLNRAS